MRMIPSPISFGVRRSKAFVSNSSWDVSRDRSKAQDRPRKQEGWPRQWASLVWPDIGARLSVESMAVYVVVDVGRPLLKLLIPFELPAHL